MRLISVMRMETPDETLALAAAGGDRAAFAALVTRHYDRIHALAWRLTGSAADAQDLTQDICAALPAKLTGWRAEARFTTWLYRVVMNAAHDLRRPGLAPICAIRSHWSWVRNSHRPRPQRCWAYPREPSPGGCPK